MTTTETPESRKVSNEELLNDIRNTVKELEAYQKIADGFRTLATLPENQGVNSRMYHFEADKYRNNAQRCATFLKQLHAIQAERGL